MDSQQLAAVESRAPVTVVVAGPGAGKTRTLVERIKWLISGGASPDSMMVVTFTNVGAHELRERLGGIKLGYLGTLHGYCFRILQRHGGAVGYREGGINLLTQEMADEMLEQTAARLHWKGSKKALLEAKQPLAQLIHKEFEHTLKRNNLCTYDGVLRDGLRLLESHTPIPLPSALIIDEAQDDAEVDWDITEAIRRRAPDMSVFVAADPDQSIFGFRGAYPQGFVKAAKRGHLIQLEHNYRSGNEICAAANALIAHNSDRLPKRTIPAVPREATVTVRGFDTCTEERSGVAMTIGVNVTTKGLSMNDIAVLCRTNDIAVKFRDAMAAFGIPVRRPRVLQLPPDWVHAMNVLNLFNDPRNDIVTERVLRTVLHDPQGTGGTIPTFKKRAIESGRWLSDVAAETNAIPKDATYVIEKIGALLPQWHIGKESVDLIAKRISLLPQSNPTLPDLLHDLYQCDQWDVQEEPCGVHVGTIHGAKGREFSHVFAPGWEEGVLPGLRKDSALEEERRLAFVCVTRAANALHISYARSRVNQWKTVAAERSRFIEEAGL